MPPKRFLSAPGWRAVMIAAAALLVGAMLYTLAQLLAALNTGLGLS
jgi:hypothetical protein